MTGESPHAVDRFEDRLLRQLHDELRTSPAPRPAPQRPRRLLLGVGALVTAGVAALAGGLIVSTATSAHAIHARSDGSFVVVLDGTTAQDLAAVEHELQDRGARIELVTETLDCLDVRRAPDSSRSAKPHGSIPDGPPPPGMFPWFDAFQVADDRRDPATGNRLQSHEWAFTVRPGAIPAGQVLWVAVNGPGTPGSGLVTVAGFAGIGAGPPQFCSTR